MRGVTRLVIFCSLTLILPTILLVVPLYLRHSLYANVVYTVAESDIMEIDDGISTIFCSEHTLKMDTPFNAFKVSQRPEVTSARKHIRLKKSMTLPDDTLEYWGFYLLKGATVALSVCSRLHGASILVVRGERSLRTCGMMDHNENKKKLKENYIPASQQQLKVLVQSNAQLINSKELFQYKGTTETSTIEEDHTILNDKDIAKSNYEVKDKENLPLTKESKNLNTSESTFPNSLDHELNFLEQAALNHIQKHILNSNGTGEKIEKLRHMRKKLRNINIQENINNGTESAGIKKIKKRELNSEDSISKSMPGKFQALEDTPDLNSDRKKRIEELKTELNSDAEIIYDENSGEKGHNRNRRNQNGIKPQVLLDRGVEHGGNAMNFINIEGDSSISSFENGLLTCYDGRVLLAQQFEPSELCTNISFLVNSKRIQTQHDVSENGYYYYIFYSDNDDNSNDMHAVFDIYKPTFQYENLTQSCINVTECSFSLGFLSGDKVIVEVPTRNGIEEEGDDLTLLTSTCRPRMGIYSIFPIAVLLLVLGCAFV